MPGTVSVVPYGIRPGARTLGCPGERRNHAGRGNRLRSMRASPELCWPRGCTAIGRLGLLRDAPRILSETGAWSGPANSRRRVCPARPTRCCCGCLASQTQGTWSACSPRRRVCWMRSMPFPTQWHGPLEARNRWRGGSGAGRDRRFGIAMLLAAFVAEVAPSLVCWPPGFLGFCFDAHGSRACSMRTDAVSDAKQPLELILGLHPCD